MFRPNKHILQHLESLSLEQLNAYLTAYPWFSSARIALAKKLKSDEAIRSCIPYVSDRRWFKKYLEGEAIQPDSKESTNNGNAFVDEMQHAAEMKVEVVAAVPTNDETSTPHTIGAEEGEQLFSSLKAATSEKNVSEHERDFVSIRDEIHSFEEWLKLFMNTSSNLAQDPTQSKKERDASYNREEDENALYPPQQIPYQLVEEKIEQETHYAKGLNDFIAAQIERKKTRAPLHFDEKHSFPVTETYARLLEQQGKLKQAIGIYEALKLKFPDKNAYFAARIAELKEKL
ncbi:MAG: hypothetical protein NZ522_09410 [Chitinophagales bacterium]|nr:hypothetical protein [Chitinophagales bacterium]